MPFTKIQRNEVFHAVVAGKLDPAACDIEFRKISFTIQHKPTKSYFLAEPKNNYWIFQSSTGTDPGIVTRHNPVRAYLGLSTAEGIFWPALIETIAAWAAEVVAWADMPDLWEIRNSWRSLSDAEYQETANTPFTAEERAAISGQLTVIREQIKKTYDLTAEQETEIDARFDEAEKASERLGRKDWILLFGGAVFSLILADVITPDIAQHILMAMVHGLEHLFVSAPRTLPGHH